MTKKLATYLAALALGVIAFAGVSYAHYSVFAHGANFIAATGSQQADLNYQSNAVRNMATSTRTIIASLDHPISTNGLSVRVNGRHTGQQTTTCAVLMMDGSGAIVGSVSQSTSVNNTNWSLFMSPLATGTANLIYGSVSCSLPANGNSRVFGYDALVN